MPDESPLVGTQSSHEEPQSRLTTTPHGHGWRVLDQPVDVEVFLGETWVSVPVVEVNDESRELWVRSSLHASGDPNAVHHQVIDASHHRAPADLFKEPGADAG